MSEIAAMRTMLQQLAGGPRPDDVTMREAYEQWGQTHPLPAGTVVERLDLGGVPAERVSPPGVAADAALLYLHGGGYVIGSAASHRHLVAALAEAAGITAYAVDYALAPEARFPVPVEQAVAAYRALIAQGLAPGRIIIAGDSAGGGLTIATALALKAAGLPQPAGLFAISPWADLTQSGSSYDAMAEVDLICDRDELHRLAGLYCTAEQREDPRASPLRGDFSGLAPLLIHVGSDEILLSDSLRLAEKAGFARVKVKLLIAPEMPHVWHFMTTELTMARTAIASAGIWMVEHLG